MTARRGTRAQASTSAPIAPAPEAVASFAGCGARQLVRVRCVADAVAMFQWTPSPPLFTNFHPAPHTHWETDINALFPSHSTLCKYTRDRNSCVTLQNKQPTPPPPFLQRTMSASCWKMDPSSWMVFSTFCSASARLAMYVSCCGACATSCCCASRGALCRRQGKAGGWVWTFRNQAARQVNYSPAGSVTSA